MIRFFYLFNKRRKYHVVHIRDEREGKKTKWFSTENKKEDEYN